MQSPHPFTRPRSVAIICFILVMIIMIGTWMKILHYPAADIVLAIGLFGQGFTIVSLGYLSLRKKV